MVALGDGLAAWNCTNGNPTNNLPNCRSLTSSSPPDNSTSEMADFKKERTLEDANPERIHGLNVNPDGIGSLVLPGNLVYKHYKFTGNTRKVPLELVHGYFWMLNDLRNTNGKPILSNETLISEEDAQTFPQLTGLETLSKVTTDVPYFFVADEGKKRFLNSLSCS